ncbi:hypothetical protein SLE2022_025600 [Rubroshorea leprosula]
MSYGVRRKETAFIFSHRRIQEAFSFNSTFVLRPSIEISVKLFTRFITVCASLSSLAGIIHARRSSEFRPHGDETYLCNSMIKAHLDMRQFDQCFTLYRDLRRESCFLPNNFTFTTLAKSCGLGMAFWEGLGVHCQVVKIGFCLDLYVSTALVDMYAKLGMMGCAGKLFDEMTERSIVSWTALICGYAKSGDLNHARKLFDQMTERKDPVLYNAMIDGYVKLGDIDSARSLFNEMPERNVISWSSMIHGYCNSGDVGSARYLFDVMPGKNLISWNTMIGGYCQNKQPHEALKLFHELQSSMRYEPNDVTIVSILPAIADLGALDLGGWIHRFVRRKKLDKATNICTALIDMYAKCGEIEKAKSVFDGMPEKERASWNALINGFAINGCAKEALKVFEEMQSKGVKPNDITMIGVLSACGHGGLVDEGKRWFKAMEDFSLTPKIEHYGCMVDMLGRAGCLEEAETLINSMPYEANGIIMSSLLFACGFSKDVTRAERILKKVINTEPSIDGNYVLLGNLYAAEKRWRDVEEIKGLMRRNGVKKEVGCSVIEVGNRVSEFVSGDRVHPNWEAVRSVIEQLWMHMRRQSNYSS